jgi:hypothetical protein
MRVNRRFLYAGAFLMAVGAVLVAADLGAVDTTALTEALRLWPLAVVAIGAGLVLRRGQFSLPTGMLAAAVPGLVLGGALAVGPRFAGDCGTRSELASPATTRGTFDGPATVSVRGGCGSISVTTVPGNSWQLDAGNTAGRAPTVDSTPRSLSIDATSDRGMSFLDAGRDAWDLTLPTSDLNALSLVVTAGHGQIGLPGTRIGTLALTANASEVVVDASRASIGDVSAVVNVGSLSIRLPAASNLTGSLRVGAGELQLCAPPGVGLHVTTGGTAKDVTVDGVHEAASEWQSPDYASAAFRSDLQIRVNFGTVEINPIGGCR